MLLYDTIANRITINEVQAEHGSLRLMKNVWWEYDKLPHMLIAGGTGGGKTYFILTLIEALLRSNAVMYVLDPKNADLADLSVVMPEVWYKKEDITACIDRFYDGMMARSEAMELKGKGCRQMESYLLAQHRSWYDFLMDTLVEGGVMKRLDIAINDMAGILDIPELTEKCNHEECISVFRSFKSYRSGELVRSNEQDKYGMGNTLYIGSLKSEVYFCIYEKDYEQYVKYDIPIEDTKIKNRFEIRLKNERAYYAVRDLLTYHDAERTAFDIINRYMRFADREVEKRRSEWQTNEKWAYFIGSDRGRLKLTTKPEPYTLTRTLNWISRQVAPTWKVLEMIDSKNGTTYLKDILDHAKLTERHKKLIEQQTTSTEEMITETEE